MPNLPRILYFLAGAMQRLRWNHEKLRNYQEKRLRKIIHYAYTHVPFYHKKFKEAGVTPSEIRTIKDLVKVPITRKDEFRKQPQEIAISEDFLYRNLRVVTTSGSTGSPLKVYMTSAEDDWRKAIYMRANICCGQKPRDRWVVIIGPNHFSDTTKLQRLLSVYARTCISVFDDVDTQISKIRRMKPDVLDGYFSSILLLAKKMEKSRSEIMQPRIVFGNAEVITEASRKCVEETFGAPYYDQYGCAEFNRMAWECPAQMGYHMDLDSVIMQFIDKEGDEVAAGETGEIVCTSLFNYAMPFIRYAVGDLGVPSEEECSCGRKLPLMKSVEGRRDSLIVLSDGRILSPRTFTVAIGMFSQYEALEQFCVVQKKPSLIEVLIKLKNSKLDKKALEAELIAHIERMLQPGRETVLNVKFVESIPLSKSGKLMAVTSEVEL
jgi:phenylacetate-CoA ligase